MLLCIVEESRIVIWRLCVGHDKKYSFCYLDKENRVFIHAI